MLRTFGVRAVVAGAAVLAAGVGAFALGTGDPVRHGTPTTPPSQVCGGSEDVQCLSGKIVWNGTGLVVVKPQGV
ncbi:hypothetical protein BX285_4010 [Streptomyces sp. 1114.5]|uniref:hypothetical protein n=1 Tax=Streptomyces sp. 1114.5 TaxID=1938830 RepID=UPI000EAD7D95|nr:hypothetical protein [Streptomyces sp. 1114.5]RKT19543.1 hypothetical protein BX285_4010 [Streptomyces sp. 1114.5]